MNEPIDPTTDESLNRRELLCATAAGAATLSGLTAPAAQAAQEQRAAVNGRIRQSIVFWCFNTAGERWDLERTCRAAQELGCLSVEIVPPEDWAMLRKHGLDLRHRPQRHAGNAVHARLQQPELSRGGHHPHAEDDRRLRRRRRAQRHRLHRLQVARCRRPQERRDQPDEGADNCVEGLQRNRRPRRETKVTICLEHLNTRDSSHPMKGHPGYQGDDLD